MNNPISVGSVGGSSIRCEDQITPIKGGQQASAPQKISIQVRHGGANLGNNLNLASQDKPRQPTQVSNAIGSNQMKAEQQQTTTNLKKFIIDQEFIDQLCSESSIDNGGTMGDINQTGDDILSSQQQQCDTAQKKPSTEFHMRMHSDYSNTPIDKINSFGANPKNKALTAKVLEILENGINNLNKEQVEEAFTQFKAAEQIFNQHPREIDDNYLAVMKYNLACCYQRMGMIDQCIKSLQDGIEGVERKISAIHDRTNASFTERSITQQSISSQTPQSGQDQELIIGNLLHKYRYLCKFHLQVCAVLSQMNKHEQAQEFGDKAAQYAMVLMNKAYDLCQVFVNEINKRREKMLAKQRSSASGAQSVDDNTAVIDDDYLPLQNSQFSPYGVKTINNTNTSQNFQSLQNSQSLYSQQQIPNHQVQVNNYFAQSRNSNSVCNRSTDSQNNTKLNIRRASSADGSLERIHTFNLKLQKLQNQKSSQQLGTTGACGQNSEILIDAATSQNNEQAINVAKINLNIKNSSVSRNEQQQMKMTTSSINSQTSTNGGGANNKAYYVEEKTKVLENIIIKVLPIVNEFQRIIKEYSGVCYLSENERSMLYGGPKKEKQKNGLKISFHDDTEINLLKFNHKFKLNVRNILGIKHQDDWIFNLNIGNVMHLTPMNTDELAAKLDRTHELNKDAMLEKIILFVVSFFCVGTELRFNSQREGSKVTKKDSEMWHAKALHTACLFLPEDCPLVNHIINSYKKHHLNPKLELLRQKKIEDELKKKQQEELAMKEINLKEAASIGSSIQMGISSKQSIDGNNSRGEENEAMKEIKQQIEHFLAKGKKPSKTKIQKPIIATQNLQKFTANNLAQINQQLQIQASEQEMHERRKSNAHTNITQSRNSMRMSGQNQLIHLSSTSSMKNLATSQQKTIAHLQAMNPFCTIQNPNTKRGANQASSPNTAIMTLESSINGPDQTKRMTATMGSSLNTSKSGLQQNMHQQQRRLTSGSPDAHLLIQNQQQVQQQYSFLNSNNNSISGARSRPLSPRNVILLGPKNKKGIQQHNLSPGGQSMGSKKQQISEQIMEQIMQQKVSPLEQAIKNQDGLGPKKILVFPNKKRFPLGQNGIGQSQQAQSVITQERKSPKGVKIISTNKVKLAIPGGANPVISGLIHSQSQRSLGSGTRGNTPVGGVSKKAKMIGANQIQLHYQQQKQMNAEEQNNDVPVGAGMTKYKSLENFPLDEILSELQKHHKKFKIMNGQNNQERPPSSNSTKNGTSNHHKQGSSQQHQPLHQQPHHQPRLGSPINQSIAQQHHQVLNYNFQNINFINNVNIFEDKKEKQQQQQQQQSTHHPHQIKLAGPRKSNGGFSSTLSKYLK